MVKQALKDRESVLKYGGTTTESAEASYRIRVMIKSLKEQHSRMAEIVEKKERKV